MVQKRRTLPVVIIKLYLHPTIDIYMSTKGIAVVTGAARGMGRAIALRLADDGFDVAVNDIPSQKKELESLCDEISRKGRKSEIVVGDVSVEEDVKSLVNRVGAALGGLDMVANAGICLYKSMMETTLDEWERLFAINSRGVFLCYKFAGEYMINQGRGGRLIAASSISGKQGTDVLGAYCATKFAVRGMTQAFAKALGKHGITVNTYAPGAIDTDMLRAFGRAKGDLDKFYADERAATAVKSVGTPTDIANLVSYLASKESRFITGQSVGFLV
ncbi:NAD(P)-binding protein [Infundibulicybe gibba]|nr:NAD(P)-binding protein [Infundibulicybe gibba]